MENNGNLNPTTRTGIDMTNFRVDENSCAVIMDQKMNHEETVDVEFLPPAVPSEDSTLQSSTVLVPPPLMKTLNLHATTTFTPVTLEFSDLRYSVRDQAAAAEASKNSVKGKGLKKGHQVYKQNKYILKDVSGVFKPGQLTAIMGPSGAGKSTLMNVLAGSKINNVQGLVTINGVKRDLATFRKTSCYIMQDDMLLPHLTVLETMKFAASLKLPMKTTREKRALLVEEIMDIIGLTECQNVKSQNISGGQRKRLAIALELLNNPPIMFFDEPTSGLDSATCLSCVTLLKSLAQGGRTIICTIHQPSARILEQFDALYLLSSGQCLYRGPVKSLVPFFSKQGLQCPPYHNPADFAIEVASGDYGEHWISLMTKATALQADSTSSGLATSTNNPEDEDDDNQQYPYDSSSTNQQYSITTTNKDKENKEVVLALMGGPGENQKQGSSSSSYSSEDTTAISEKGDGRFAKFCYQFWILLQRSFKCIYRDQMLTHLRFASTILVGLLIGAIFPDAGNNADLVFNNAGNVFFGLMFMVFSSMMATVLTFPLERGVLIREHLNCWYSLKAYYLARTLADLPFQLFFPFLYTVITYFMTGQPHEAFRFWIIAGMNTLISLVAQAIGLVIGAACHIQSAVFVAPVMAIPVFLFGGFFVTLSTVPAYLRWLAWVSYARYAFQAAIVGVYGLDREDLKCYQPYCHFKNPRKFLVLMDCEGVDILEHSLYLIGILVVCRFLAYFALRLKIYAEKQ